MAAVCVAVALAACLAGGAVVGGQQLLDRVLAIVETVPITLSDVRAFVGLGVATGDLPSALQQVVDRQLLLLEVQRFPPPEPPVADIDAEVARLLARPAVKELMQETGFDAARIRDVARQSLRIRGYLEQRFGTSVQVSDEDVDRYYRAHQDEFLRDGLVIPFSEAEPLARERASSERLNGLIDQWIADLRTRADVRILDS